MNLDLKNINLQSIYRMALYVAIALVGVFLWNAWTKDHPSHTVQNESALPSHFHFHPCSLCASFLYG